MNVVHQKVSTGSFTVPDGGGKADSTGLEVHREGVSGLASDLEFLRWSDILCVKVSKESAEWILKDRCTCGADLEVVNLNCDICDMFGVKPGRVIVIPHPAKDESTVDWYLSIENLFQYWARQSNRRSKLSDGTPVFNLDIPRFIFTSNTVRNALSEEQKQRMVSYQGGSLQRNFAYHDEYRRDKLIQQLKRDGLVDLIALIEAKTPKALAKKEVTYGRYDSVFS
jgi:hypothetical protein